MPEELFIERAELDGAVDDAGQRLRDGPSERVHLQGSFPKSTNCTLLLFFRLQPRGIVTGALLTSLLTFVFLAGGLVARFAWKAQALGELPAAILLALPGLFAAYLFSPDQHRLLRKVFAGLQSVVLGLAALSFVAAALLAITPPPGGRLRPWIVLTVVSGIAVVVVAVARATSESVAKARGVGIIRA